MSQAFHMSTFLDPFPMSQSSVVPKQGCTVARRLPNSILASVNEHGLQIFPNFASLVSARVAAVSGPADKRGRLLALVTWFYHSMLLLSRVNKCLDFLCF